MGIDMEHLKILAWDLITLIAIVLFIVVNIAMATILMGYAIGY